MLLLRLIWVELLVILSRKELIDKGARTPAVTLAASVKSRYVWFEFLELRKFNARPTKYRMFSATHPNHPAVQNAQIARYDVSLPRKQIGECHQSSWSKSCPLFVRLTRADRLFSRQVQDLEKQLNSTKQQLQQLRSGVKSDNVMDIEFDPSGQPVLKLPDVGGQPFRQNRPPIAQDFSRVRANIRSYGSGIVKVPPPYRQVQPSSFITENGPALPPKPLADRLLSQYHTYVHSVLPIIHWPSFTADYQEVYQRGTLRGSLREWAAVLFGVFACGVMHTLDSNKQKDAQAYLLVSQTIVDMWLDDFSLDQARVSLLASIALYEMNSRSSSWVWLGSAVRIAQDIGLHIESGPWSAVEREMRRRLWWGIYAWDRYVNPHSSRIYRRKNHQTNHVATAL